LGLGGSSEDMTAVLPRRVVFEKEKKMKIGLGVETNKHSKNSTAINKNRKRRKRTKTQTTTRIVQLSLSDSHGAALDQNGNVWTWGSAPSLGRRCVFWIVLVFCRSCMYTLFQGFWIFQVL
jgi:alpha-tubulin suppressor-like RCC1 family protein